MATDNFYSGAKMTVRKLAFILAAIYLACGQAAFADEFQNLKCGSDIPKAMIGKRSLNVPVVQIEKKYQALGLKDLGGDEISDSLSSVNWLICGGEYIELIDKKGMVRDVLVLPPHSKAAPAFSGYCQTEGKDLPDVIIAVLDGEAAKAPLPVKTAWKIDPKQAKFVAIPPEGLLCPKDGIYSADGGS
jgi:hypothetical protein